MEIMSFETVSSTLLYFLNIVSLKALNTTDTW